jgi:parallel beta-helix repeat protein
MNMKSERKIRPVVLPVAASTLLLALGACSLIFDAAPRERDGNDDPGDDDTTGDRENEDIEGNDETPPPDQDDEAGEPDGEEELPPCIEPVRGLEILEDVTFCPGTYDIASAVDSPAMTIGANDVTVECLGTVIVGTGELGTAEAPTVGLKAMERDFVTVRGCTLRGYRYGVLLDTGMDAVLDDVHLDGNYSDPDLLSLGQDLPTGGGLLLSRISHATVTSSSFGTNWNGIEIVHSSDVTVEDCTADHCSNAGVILLESHASTIRRTDVSHTFRGDDLVYPTPWYGETTWNSAGIIVSAGSEGNTLESNNATYCGQGIAVRAGSGMCATITAIQGNDVSYSANEGIACACWDCILVDNTASDSNFGVWLQGTDGAYLYDNTVERNMKDGISVQAGRNRHVTVDGNTIADNGRAGLLFSGRKYPAYVNLAYWDSALANASQLVVQRNSFDGNADADVFVTSARSVVFASNCSGTLGEPDVVLDREVELAKTLSDCGSSDTRSPPAPILNVPVGAPAGTSVDLDATGSAPFDPGDTLTFTWLVQTADAQFSGSVFPTPLLAGDGAAIETVTFDEPGLFDVDVTVDDGWLASMADYELAIAPVGAVIGASHADWDSSCTPDTTAVTFVDEAGFGATDNSSLHALTYCAYDLELLAPQTQDFGLDASALSTLSFFVRVDNRNELGWQGFYPVVVLASVLGAIRYEPTQTVLSRDPYAWTLVEVPLAGDALWNRRIDAGASLARVDWIELHFDTLGYSSYDLWIDDVTFH